MSTLALSHVIERDVDLLLTEELTCCARFQSWFTQQLQLPAMAAVIAVEQSKRHLQGRREIDLFIRYRDDQGLPVAVLVENKLDTTEQEEQAEGYRLEAERLAASSAGFNAHIVLCCPAAYARMHAVFAAKFDGVLSYEKLRDYFGDPRNSEDVENLRTRFRVALLTQAIDKLRRGYEPILIPVIGSFNKAYVALCGEIAPTLRPGPAMLKDGNGVESKTQIFASESLPRWDFLPSRMRLVHQLREGNANFCLGGWGDRFGRQVDRFNFNIDAGRLYLAKTSKSLMICVDTPPVDNLRPFADQTAAIADGIRACSQLLEWVQRNRTTLADWAAM